MIAPIIATTHREGMSNIRTYPSSFKPYESPSVRPAYLSASSVKSYLSCSLKFYFEKVARIRKPTSIALHVGKVAHAALQTYNLALWRDEDSSIEAIRKVYLYHFSAIEADEGPVTYPDETSRDKSRECGWNVVQAFLESPEAILNQKPIGVEVMLQSKLLGLEVPVRGAIDLVQDNLVLVDYKTAASKPDIANTRFDHELQLVTYQMLIEESTGEIPPSLDLIYLIKTKMPQVMRITNKPACKTRKQRIIDLYNIALDGITNERFHPQSGMQCSWCLFKTECTGWRAAH